VHFAGDLWSHNQEQDAFVVSPMPDVHVLVADASKHRCLILGTDGLWNVMTPLQAVQIVQQTERFNESCYEEVWITSHAVFCRSTLLKFVQEQDTWINPSHCLVEKALQQWANLKLRADNTSVVTLMLDPPGPPRFQVG
jgi:protein phosphatase 1D